MPASLIFLNCSSTFTAFIPEVFIGEEKKKKKRNPLPLFFGLANVTFKHEATNPLTDPFFHCSVREKEKRKIFQKLPVTIELTSKNHPS